ncbi:uroporphyrinogen-III C-methyltransferase [Immundisolibacter sp.]|uniref:uroporphyrinogen-III C-methyltransferase n=1 Tax=Immundisolibacter sp. TaxID=1934948 RepID=UPI00356504D1
MEINQPDDGTPAAETSEGVQPARKKSSGGRVWLLLLTLVLVVFAAAAGVFWVRFWQPLQLQVAAFSHAEERAAQRLDALVAWQATVSDDLAALEGRSRGLEARLEQVGPARLVEWSLAEAAYLLSNAQRAARLDADPKRAALALELAGASLAPVPGSAGLRAAIDSAQRRLRNIEVPDADILASELAEAGRVLKDAPLREPGQVSAAREPSATGWRSALGQAWQQLREVVVLQRVGAPLQPLLRPDEQRYLRQQLALKFAAAEYALRRRNQAALRSELADVQVWAEAYLETDGAPVAKALAAVRRVADTELRPQLPDLTDLSVQLDALRRRAGAVGRRS